MRQNNGCPSKQWNLGLSQSEGEYLDGSPNRTITAEPAALLRRPSSTTVILQPQRWTRRVSVVDRRPGQ